MEEMAKCLVFLRSVAALGHQVFVSGKQQTGSSVPNWRGQGKKERRNHSSVSPSSRKDRSFVRCATPGPRDRVRVQPQGQFTMLKQRKNFFHH